MAQVQFFRGNIATLPATGVPLSFYLVEDTKQIFRADASGLIHLYSDVIVGALPPVGVQNKLYISNGKLYIYTTQWVEIQTGGGGEPTPSNPILVEWEIGLDLTANMLVANQTALYRVEEPHTSTTITADVASGKLVPIIAANNIATEFFYTGDNIVRIEKTGDNQSITTFTYTGGNLTQQVETTPLFITTTTLTYSGDDIQLITTNTERR